ncbi:hypothetical protein HOLleu_01650 [Holothuria leucospilota]|uniref:Reverse transcriptase/retrotransposon-derived protein RNase H-like domain-containing protein n=1 Tax=Holothuria leucospilota TaxID=206669 RepID=A0A9Q1HGK0_HOLLE|nr:hypothetical protein HOLleu_01650 [Holothuria leucospilota]
MKGMTGNDPEEEVNYAQKKSYKYVIVMCNFCGKKHRKDAKNCVPLLGSRAIQQMELITVRFENISLPETEINQVEESTRHCMTKEEVYSEFRDLLKGIGQIPGIIHLTTDPSVPPVVAPPRRVPVAMKPKLKKELARLEGLNIIEKVVEPTDWVSNLQKLDQNLEGLSGIHIIADDILITGKGETMQEAYRDHDKNLIAFLERCRERSIKLNKEKFNLHCEEINFMGHTLTANGLKADPHKIEAIEKMPEPNDVPGVQRFVGMVKYLSKFLPSLSNKCEPLNRLTHKHADWHWGEEQQQAFQEIKHLVSIAPVLRHFDQRIPLEGQGDASEKGLGFALLQNAQPITYASRSLTPAETRYSQKEKELLALVFGLERNHVYTYGHKLKLWTDHKPLIAISKKPLVTAPKRLQRLLIRLLQYDVEICYNPAKKCIWQIICPERTLT